MRSMDLSIRVVVPFVDQAIKDLVAARKSIGESQFGAAAEYRKSAAASAQHATGLLDVILNDPNAPAANPSPTGEAEGER